MNSLQKHKKLILIIAATVVLAVLLTGVILALNQKSKLSEIAEALPNSVFYNESVIHEKREVGEFEIYKTWDQEIVVEITFLNEKELKITRTGYVNTVRYEDGKKTNIVYDDEEIFTYQLDVSFFGKKAVSLYSENTGYTVELVLKPDPYGDHPVGIIEANGLSRVCEFCTHASYTFEYKDW